MAGSTPRRRSRRTIAALNAFTPRPDLVVISGDVADLRDAREYAHARDLLAALAIPYVAIPGNHDDRALMRAGFPELAFAQSHGAMNAVHPVGEIDIVLLDSTVPGAAHGALDAETLSWLDERLPPRRRARRFSSCTIRRSTPASATWTRSACATPTRSPPCCGGTRGHDWSQPAMCIARRKRRSPAARPPFARRANRPVRSISPAGWARSTWKSRRPSTCMPGCRASDFGTVVTHLLPVGDVAGPYPFAPANT